MDQRIKLTSSLSFYFYSIAEVGDLDTCRTGQLTQNDFENAPSPPQAG